MPLLLQIYLYCVAGACIYVVLLTFVVKPFLNIDNEYDATYALWNNVPLHYRIGAVFIPVLNAVFSFMVLVLIYTKIRWWWYDLGHFITLRFTKGKNFRYFRAKEFVIKTFFRFWIDLYYKRLENDIWDKMLKKIHEESKDGKAT
jgi:hypothetical protein